VKAIARPASTPNENSKPNDFRASWAMRVPESQNYKPNAKRLSMQLFVVMNRSATQKLN
jgi:hypothetical protein